MPRGVLFDLDGVLCDGDRFGKFRDADLEPARADLVLESVAELPTRWAVRD